jgi:signal transduction histidine kinase/ActR/RegA family two-component response regulator
MQALKTALEESEKRFRAFVSATSDVVYRMSPDWSEMRHLVGQDFIADTTDPSRSWLEKYIHPDDQPLVLETIRQAIRTKSVFQLEHRVIRVDGTLGWTFSRAIPLMNDQGEIVEWFGAASDVTNRRLTEEKLQAQLTRLSLLDAITRAIAERQDVQSIFQVVIRTLEQQLPVDFAAICLHDRAAKRLTVTRVGAKNAMLAKALGLPEHAHVAVEGSGLDRCMRGELVYEPDISQTRSPLAAQLLQGGLEAVVISPLSFDGRVFGVLVAARASANSFSSGDCEFLRQLSEHLSLATHQAQLHSSLQTAYEDLRQSQQSVMQQERLRALGQLASGIAHDINNALSPAALYTQALLEREVSLSQEARDRLVIVNRAIDDVGATVARMRTFYRPRDVELTLSPIDLNQLLQQVAELTRARWRDMAQQHGTVIELQGEYAPQLPAVMGAESEIRDALTNLVLNAVDAMPGGGTLTLRTRVKETRVSANEATRSVIVEVRDTGTGMTEAVRNRCLEPFFTTKGERGTGLGLAMVYGMAQRHSADLEIDSEPGRGTTMRIAFQVTAITASEPRSPDAAAMGPLRLLLIDDDPLLLQSLQDVLSMDGHQVTAADGGQRGIDEYFAARARGEPFAVVVTDLGMPKVDGRTVAAAIKSASPETPVVLLTGWGQRLRDEAQLPENVDRVLSKPPRVSELRSTLVLLGANLKPRN